jgi:hypothetical protein
LPTLSSGDTALTFSLQVYWNNQHSVLVGDSTNKVLFLTAPQVTSITPNNGPSSGGTAITVTGTFSSATHSLVTERIFCQFGQLYIKAVVLSNTQLSCESSKLPLSRYSHGVKVPFRVSYGYSNAIDSSNGVEVNFEYSPDAIVHEVIPSGGPCDSNEISDIAVKGENYMNSYHVSLVLSKPLLLMSMRHSLCVVCHQARL